MQLTKYIDPTIGNVGDEDSDYSHGGGKTHPGACLPGGCVQLCADTVTGGDNGTGYNYCQNTIEGFSFNRMSGIGWYGDLGNLQVMPVTGGTDLRSGTNEFFPLKKGKEGWKSGFTHEKEKATALSEIDRVNKKLSNASFVDKAPAAVVEAEKAKLAKYTEMLANVEDMLKNLGK